MQPTSPDMQDSTGSTPTALAATESLGRTLIHLTPSINRLSFSNIPDSADMMEKLASSIYIPELAREQRIERDDEELLALLYQPSVANCTREMSQLNSLQYCIQGSLANIWKCCELFPNITNYVFSISLRSDVFVIRY